MSEHVEESSSSNAVVDYEDMAEKKVDEKEEKEKKVDEEKERFAEQKVKGGTAPWWLNPPPWWLPPPAEGSTSSNDLFRLLHITTFQEWKLSSLVSGVQSVSTIAIENEKDKWLFCLQFCTYDIHI